MSVAQLPLENSFLARDGFRRALTGTGIGMGALTAHGQAAAVAATPVTAQVHQSLHVHGHFAAEVAFDLKFLVDGLADPHQFVVGEVALGGIVDQQTADQRHRPGQRMRAAQTLEDGLAGVQTARAELSQAVADGAPQVWDEAPGTGISEEYVTAVELEGS